MTDRPTKRQRALNAFSVDSEAKVIEDNSSRHSTSEHSLPIGNKGVGSQLHLNASSQQQTTRPSVADSRLPSLTESTFPSLENTEHQMLPVSSTTSCKVGSVGSVDARQSCQSVGMVHNSLSPAGSISDGSDGIIDDYDSFDELFNGYFSEGNIATQNSNYKPHRQPQPSQSTLRKHMHYQGKFAKTTKRFFVPSKPDSEILGSNCKHEGNGGIPWTQQYQPLNLEELAVHKKKVSDVHKWLHDAFTGSDNKLLVLRGPAGSGKTTTMSLLSSTLGFDILEWKNPPVTRSLARGFVPAALHFDEFLGRCHSFRGLDLDEVIDAPRAKGVNSGARRRRVILVEEFPAVLKSYSSTLNAFRISLHRYLAMTTSSTSNALGENKSNENPVSPIVLIVSETLLNSGPSSEALTVHRLLGPELYNHASTTVIDFNSIAPTFIYKALEHVLEKESHHSKRYKFPGAAVLRRISQSGDIRSAISSLEFLCVKGEGVKERKEIATRVRKKPRNVVTLTPKEEEYLKLISQRESSLGLFHAVGKIVYNKRENKDIADEADRFSSPPDRMSLSGRLMVSQVPVNELVDGTGTDIQTFISALHENYVPSCDGPSFTGCLDGCIEALSDSDIMYTDRKRSYRSWTGVRVDVNGTGSGVDVVQQQDISYQVAARGLLFSLPHPVKRRVNCATRTNDAHRIFFPTSLRLCHYAEEIEALARFWMKRFLDSLDKQTRGLFLDPPNPSCLKRNQATVPSVCDNLQPPIVTMTSHNDMLLYQLPYMARISADKECARDLQKITCIHGTSSQCETLDGHDIYLNCGTVLNSSFANKSSVVRVRGNRTRNNKRYEPRLPSAYENMGERFVLSDDDILDD